MPTVDELIDEFLGEDDALTDIRAVVRRLWFYDFVDFPFRIWQGKGKLHTSDGNVWLGSIDAQDYDHHITSALQDGRDGSSPQYTNTLNLIDIPGSSARELHDALRAEQSRVANRTVTCYLAAFRPGEGLRPETPIAFFKELTMMFPKFSEKLEGSVTETLRKKYSVSVVCKDGNFGRSNVPGGTYADTIQKQRALELGVSVDKGSEFLALLANRTYQLP